MSYSPQISEINFLLENVLESHQLYQCDTFPDFDKETMIAIIDAAREIASELLAPLNKIGDTQGLKLIDGNVILPDGFKAAFKTFAENGWYGVGAPSQYGGQNLPKTLEIACYEMFYGANMAFTMLPTLPIAACAAIDAHGSEEQKNSIIPNLLSGKYLATMALTEPQAGSDLASLSTQAIIDENGKYRLYGQKIFISYADHDVSENIFHLVLARLPDAPAGTKGISLFLCPKFVPNFMGGNMERNQYSIIGLEHKMGLHASPTCVMQFDGAIAQLMGPANGGLQSMFTMMNEARIGVGIQGAGISDAAFQKALEHSKIRIQGKTLLSDDKNAPIFNHPDIRLSLGIMKTKAQTARAICLQAAIYNDLYHANPAAKENQMLNDFLVPIAKAYSTELGNEVTSQGIQIHGGMGFIEETGAAQYYRDFRIAAIYEGTNAIQALDLIGRKLGTDGARANLLQREIEKTISNAKKHPNLSRQCAQLELVLADFINISQQIIDAKANNMADAASGASAYLMFCGDLIGGWLWLKTAIAVLNYQGDEYSQEFLNEQLALMEIYYAHILSRAHGRLEAINLGAKVLQKLNFDF